MRAAAALTAGKALPMAIPRPAPRIMGMSFTSSPTAQIACSADAPLVGQPPDRRPLGHARRRQLAEKTAIERAAEHVGGHLSGHGLVQPAFQVEHLLLAAHGETAEDARRRVAQHVRPNAAARAIELQILGQFRPSAFGRGLVEIEPFGKRVGAEQHVVAATVDDRQRPAKHGPVELAQYNVP